MAEFWKPINELFRNECRRLVREVDPKLEDSVVKIMEEAEDMYRLHLIADACRRRIQQKHPDLDEFGIDEIMKCVPMPPMLMVVSALVKRMDLLEEERKQQVAAMMACKVC